jgi:ribosomal protein L37E
VDEKLKVLLRVSEKAEGAFGTTSLKPVLEFTGETELTLPELRMVLSYVVLGGALPQKKAVEFTEESGLFNLLNEDDRSYDQEVLTTEPLIPAAQDPYGEIDITTWDSQPKSYVKRKAPRRKTTLVCEKCGRKVKGMSRMQRYCNKPDCAAVAAARWQAQVSTPPARPSQKGIPKRYPAGREAPTPLTPAVCQRCGRKYMAYSRTQKYCNLPDCHIVVTSNRRRGWTSQATIVAGQGVTAGAV